MKTQAIAHSTLVRFCGLLAALALVISCSSPEATKLRYDTEKLFHTAEKLASDAEIKDQLRDETVVREIRDAYGVALSSAYSAIEQVDRSRDSIEYIQLSQIALRSAARLSQFFFAIRNYDTCTTILNDLLGRLSLPPMETAATWVNLGQALQAAGKWDSAVVIYDKAIELINPPVDNKGDVIAPVFSLPAQIYGVYKRTGDSANARQEFGEAVGYYERFARQREGTKLALGSWAMLGSLYSQEGRWQDAIAALQQLREPSGNLNWRASARIADITAIELKDPARAFQMYEEVEGRLTGQDTLIRPQLIFKRALALLEMKQYEQARELLVDLSRSHRQFYVSNAAPQFVKAKSFELEGNWQRAETEYRYLIDNYPTSEQAMGAYLYLGEELAKRNRQAEADKWMARADEFFSSVASRGSGTRVEARALTYRAELLRRNGDWQGAADMMLQVFEKFPNESQGHAALVAAAGITRDRLNDPAKADSLMQVLRRVLTTPQEEPSES